ncbi:MAG: methionine--tRNA ligase [Actinobacteria bacterium 13_2_20CM_2_66_6]|nr:MAG: methionine--tRNA ligase [Actinobacteria bacterium 13_2_20CM_2_66_6]
MPRTVFVAPAWPYANGPRHIGHLAGFAVPADVLARFERLRGSRVLMASGTDEHGTPITYEADKKGVAPREFVDENNAIIVEDLRRLGMTYDIFTRTTTANHYRVTQDMFLKLYEKGYLVKRTQMGAIDPTSGRTLPDRYIEGKCPICGFPDARGDQCDNCGNQLDPIDLINPHQRGSDAPVEFRETEHFFFDLPAFGEQLKGWIEQHDSWRPNVRKYSLEFVRNLKPRAITRDLDWGVPVPLPGWEDNPHKKIYVWFDAVIGYLSASIEWAQQRGEPDAWKDWWQNPDSWHYYVMGKDNITFHTVLWPAILMGVGELELPDEIVASEYLNMSGRKLSTSRGGQIIFVRDFLDRFDADALRYYLMIAGPENQDTDFTWDEFVRRNNDELVATWGNLVHRTLVNAHRNFGAVPKPQSLTPADRGLIEEIESGLDHVAANLEQARFQNALKLVMGMAAKVNVYLGTEQPWHAIKTDRERAGTVLYVALRCVDNLETMLSAFLPFSSQRLHTMLGYQDVIAPQPDVREYAEDGTSHKVLTGTYSSDNRWRPSELEPGRPLPVPEALFKRLDDVVEEPA